MPEVTKVREHHKRYNYLRASRNLYNTNGTPEIVIDSKNTSVYSSNFPQNYKLATSEHFSTISNDPSETFTASKNLSSTIYSRKLANLESYNRR